MKKLRRILLFLLILPLCFAFSSCKKNGDNGDNSGGNNGDSNNSGGSTKTTYSVSFDYNLPEDYDYLLNDYTVSNKEVGSQTTLAKVSDSKLVPYFLGWTEEDSDEIIVGTVTSATERTIKLKGKWNVADLKKYYYSDGLTFEIGEENSKVIGYTGSQTNVIIPRVFTGTDDIEYPVSEIADDVFLNKNVSKVVMNVYGVSVGANAFKNTNLSEIDFDVINGIGDNAFENTKLENVKLSSILKSAGDSAFKGCEELTTVDFSNISIDISNEMFSGCKNLTTILNATNTKNIGDYAFNNCSNLNSFDFVSNNAVTIGEFAFAGCVGLQSVTIPNSVTTIYGNAFDGCVNLTDLTISRLFATSTDGSDNLLKHIGSAVNIEKITLYGENISRLPKNYFDGLVNLKTFVMCDSISYIENNTFRECAKLDNITLSKNIIVSNFSINAFYGTKFLNDMSEPFVYSNAILYVPETISAEYSIPEGVTRINKYAFKGNKSIQKITIPSTVDFIGLGAFESCSNLTEVVFTLNENLTELSNRLFYNCSSLSSVNLSNLTALTKIGSDAFRSVKISNFVVPSTVTQIGNDVFSYANISEFSISGESENFVCEDGVLFQKNGANRTLVAYPMLKITTFYVVPSYVNEISSQAFLGVRYLKNIYFTQEEISWGYTGSESEKYYNVFENTFGITLFSEKATVSSTELDKNYYLLSTSNYEYDAEADTITLVDGFEMTTQYNFIKYYDGQKIYLIYFELTTDAEGVVSIVEDSIFKMETNLQK